MVVHSNTVVYVQSECGNFFLTSFEVPFFRASFSHIIKEIDRMGHAAQIFKSRNIVKQCL